MDGRLAEHFTGVGFKKLSAVDCISEGVSHQHELNVSSRMREFLGEERQRFRCHYLRLTGSIESLEVTEEDSFITYYNSREGKPRAAEFRLTYPASSEVMQAARRGDWCWLFRSARESDLLLMVIAEGDSSVARQLDRVIGTGMRESDEDQRRLQLGDLSRSSDAELDVDDTELLTLLGVQAEVRNLNALDRVIDQFGDGATMPTSRDLAAFTRSICETADPRQDPDRVLWDWYALTTEMFFGLEKVIIGPVVDAAMANRPTIDLDSFFALATKYKNSRFSRAGATFEAHWEALLMAQGVTFEVLAKKSLPDGSRPDFLFPGLRAYMDPETPPGLLTFLAAKTSTKERWMQVVAEAPRIPESHLATLDKDLNESVLRSMSNKRVHPVIPQPVIASAYPVELAQEIMTVADFVHLVRTKQSQLAM